MTLYIGSVQTIRSEITVAGVATDPTSLAMLVTTPSGVTTRYVYGEDEEIVKIATGVYEAQIDCAESGMWQWRWESPGPAAEGADQGAFSVVARNVGVPA